MPAIYALYVINKSGGLIYNKVCWGLQHDSYLKTTHLRRFSTRGDPCRAGIRVNGQPEYQRHFTPGEHMVRLIGLFGTPIAEPTFQEPYPDLGTKKPTDAGSSYSTFCSCD
jgi:hypothetical protein